MEFGLYPKVTVSVAEPAGGGMFETVTVIVVPTGPDVGVLVFEVGGGMTVKVLEVALTLPAVAMITTELSGCGGTV